MKEFPVLLNGHHDKPIGRILLSDDFVKDVERNIQEMVGSLNLSVEYTLYPNHIQSFSFVTELKPKENSSG